MRRVFRLSTLMLALVLLFSAMMPSRTKAEGFIDMDQEIDFTISYLDGVKGIKNASFDLYLVATVDKAGNVTLTDKFAPYQNTVTGLKNPEELDADGWNALSLTLKAAVQLDGVPAVKTMTTDQEGNVSDKMEAGLYLVVGRPIKQNGSLYVGTPFMAMLPGRAADANEWVYQVTALPKFDAETLTVCKALKIWNDEGYESLRPEEVEVNLLCDGEVFDTQILNDDNNWRYTWEMLDNGHDWLVAETPVEGYDTLVDWSGTTFTLTNTYSNKIISTDPPVQKRIIGDKPETDEVFTFVMRADTEGAPMPEGSEDGRKEITIKGAGTAEFGSFDFTKGGEYVYTVAELNTRADGYTYDKTIYTLTYQVVETANDISYTLDVVTEKGREADAIVFTNEYEKEDPKLPYTGMYWWPVPVLAGLGLISIFIGVAIRRRQEQ